MSAAIASRRRPSRMASAIKGSSSTTNTRTRPILLSKCISVAYWKSDTRRQQARQLTGGMRLVLRLVAFSLIAVAVIGAGTFAYQSATAAAPSFSEVLHGSGSALSQADGLLPDDATVFDDQYAGVASLDSDLLAALRAAANVAAKDGVQLYVNSGWRSRNYQTELLSEAVTEYGSMKEAAKWVATADTSPHVAGEAVDIGPPQAASWLSDHGEAFGLCQI